jgi:hypothetical protein
MNSEGFAAEQHQIQVMEPWPDEPGKEARFAWARSGVESVCGDTRLRKLRPSPFRSIGGYLDYRGWPDCQRFMELDRAIQADAHESHNTNSGADSDDCPVESYSENLDYGYRFRNGSCLTADYANTKGAEHGTAPSFADVIGKLEDLPVRRL